MKKNRTTIIWWSIILSCLLFPIIGIYALWYFDPFLESNPFKVKIKPTFSEFSMHIAIEERYRKSKCVFINVKKDNLPPNFRMKIVVDNPTTSMDTTFADLSTYGFMSIDGGEKKIGPHHPRYHWRIPEGGVKGFTIIFVPLKEVFKDDIVFAVNYLAECPS